ncbi:hypothetical protein BCR39DRAFT_359953 [Naematelia encephala]|uniref:Uncharacterized protein n=1 Tax=Naematelia encephala TaxID=71784 RepID=A0A1Y2ALC7_9TREE|nr:hypothetical protein BCR39DRAFT_359953 [Naematelia encephala]
MPSLFKKFRHRKNSSSASSASSYTSTPPSPVAATGASSSSARRASLPHSPRRSDLTNPSAPMMADRSEDDVVVIGTGIEQTSISGGGGDTTGHSQPFGDESYRPDLPTTTSNVNNPAPDTSTLGWTANKALPTLPEVRTPQPGPSTLAEFPLPPTDHNTSAPLPHVDSVDRGRLHESEEERPKPVMASSDVPRNGDVGKFPHVSDLPVQQGRDGLDGDWTTETLEAMEIPARNVSLLPDVNPTSPFAQNNQATNELDYTLTTRPDLRNIRDPDITPEEHIAKYLENFTVFHTVAPSTTKSINYAEWDTPALKAARNETVTRIAREAYARESERAGLTSKGVDVFRKSGLGDKVGLKGTIDVHTQWLEPVIQERIRRIEVTEYFTIIDREIHKYHI